MHAITSLSLIVVNGGRLQLLNCDALENVRHYRHVSAPLRQHVSPVSQTCFFHLRRIRSVRRQLGRDVTAKLVTTLVLSRLTTATLFL